MLTYKGSMHAVDILGWGIAQAVEHSPVKVGIIRLSLLGRCICSLGYFLFQPVVQNWSIKSCGMCCHVCWKVHIKDPLLFIGKSSVCGKIGFRLKQYVRMAICLTSNGRWYENQCVLEASLNKINFAFAVDRSVTTESDNTGGSTRLLIYSIENKSLQLTFMVSVNIPITQKSKTKLWQCLL